MNRANVTVAAIVVATHRVFVLKKFDDRVADWQKRETHTGVLELHDPACLRTLVHLDEVRIEAENLAVPLKRALNTPNRYPDVVDALQVGFSEAVLGLWISHRHPFLIFGHVVWV